MCLGVPAVVVDIEEDSNIVKVDYGDGVLREVLLGISEERVSRGDVVMVHAGVIISKISIEGLYEQIEFIKELLKDVEGERPSEELIEMYENIVQLAKRLRNV